MKKSEVYILGNFGYIKNVVDGQIAKTRSILELLQNNNIDSIEYFDTQILRFKPLYVFTMFWKLLKSRRLFYLGAQGSVKYILPAVWIISKIFRVEIHYFVIGGWIAEFIKRKPIHKYILKRINKIYCETDSMVQKLSTWYGYTNVIWFPNIRIHSFTPIITYQNIDPLRLVFMARITKLKGIDVVFRLAENIKKAMPVNSVIIDFYGPVEDNSTAEFFEGVSNFDFISYKGILGSDNLLNTLASYDIMLFPTRYPGEGFPGTILDSYISGIPVLASDWRYNSELVIHGKTGFIFNLNNEDVIIELLVKLYNDRDLLFKMKKNAHQKSKDYSPERVWEIIEHSTDLTANT